MRLRPVGLGGIGGVFWLATTLIFGWRLGQVAGFQVLTSLRDFRAPPGGINPWATRVCGFHASVDSSIPLRGSVRIVHSRRPSENAGIGQEVAELTSLDKSLNTQEFFRPGA